MDEEDLREAEESRVLQTAEGYAGFGTTESDSTRRAGLVDLLKTGGETMGVKLLKKMGWKEGQGIGPKVRRKANLGDDAAPGEDRTDATYLFAPENSPMVSFVHKSDHKGLGYEGEARLEKPGGSAADESDEEASGPLSGRRLLERGKPEQPKPKEPRRGAFGVGVLNDTGSDDEDPYSLGPQISYNRVLGGEKKNRKKKTKPADQAKPVVASSNPLLTTKPLFISRKAAASRNSAGFRKCHDGRLPLDGFVLADGISSLSLSQGKVYPPPEVPKDWISRKTPSQERDTSNYVSTKEAAKASSLDPSSRAAMLGETQLPGKSIFDWMTPESRDRIAKITGKTDLPPALGEKAPKGYEVSDAQKRRDLWDLVPKLDKQLAVQALNRAVSGWMPYSDDEEKRSRYRTFLEVRAGLRDGLPARATGSTTDDWVAELEEFTRGAEVFKPMSGIMASRFTSASTGPKSTSETPDPTADPQLLTKPAEKPEDPAVSAAKIGMFGQMTRSTLSFYPSRLLCKRFNVKPPAHVELDPRAENPEATSAGPFAGSGGRFQSAGCQAPSGAKELVPKEVMDQLVTESGVGRQASSEFQGPGGFRNEPETAVKPEQNAAIEGERPGEAVFKAIFGSDDEDEEMS